MYNRAYEWIELTRAFQAVELREAERTRQFGAAAAGRLRRFVNPVPALVDSARRLINRRKRAISEPTKRNV